MNPRHPQPATRRLASCGGPKACSVRAPDVTGMNWLSAILRTVKHRLSTHGRARDPGMRLGDLPWRGAGSILSSMRSNTCVTWWPTALPLQSTVQSRATRVFMRCDGAQRGAHAVLGTISTIDDNGNNNNPSRLTQLHRDSLNKPKQTKPIRPNPSLLTSPSHHSSHSQHSTAQHILPTPQE